MYAKSVLKVMQGEATTGAIPPEFITTDRILQRWVVSGGSGMPTPLWDDNRKSKPPPLDDDSAIIIERIVIHSPPRTYRVLDGWYRTPAPTKIIAKKLGMSPRSLEQGLLVCLNYVKWKIECNGNRTLLKLLRVHV